MPNPYTAVLLLCAFLGALWGAERFGYDRGFNVAEVECGKARKDALQALSQRLADESARAADAERRGVDAARRGAALSTSLAASLEGLRNAKLIPADCIDAAGRLHIKSSITAINGYSSASVAVKLSGKLPNAAATGSQSK